MLFEAIRHGHLETVQEMLSQNIDVNQRDDKGNTPLLLAAEEEHTEIAILLIEHQADVHASNLQGHTVWGWAAFTRNLALMTHLAQHGINPGRSIIDDDGNEWNALLLAAEDGELPIVRFLVEQGVDVNTVIDNGRTAFISAASEGHLHVLDYLLAQGVDLQTPSRKNCVALLYAAGGGHNDVVQYLLELGVSVDVRHNGWTAFLVAAQNGKLETIKLLLQHGADINETVEEQQWKGRNALIIACSEDYSDIVRFLIDRNAELNAKSANDDWTGLMWSIKQGNRELVTMLLEGGADIHTVVEHGAWKGHTPLMLAAGEGHVEIVRLLCEQGAALETTLPDGWTALMLAAHRGDLKTVETLIEQGADVNTIVKAGKWKDYTALMAAILKKHIEIVRFLLARGAKADTGHFWGETALTLALKIGSDEIVDILTEHLVSKRNVQHGRQLT